MGFLFAVIFALAGLQDPVPTGTAAIEGVVTRAGTSQPIEKAHVTIWGDKGSSFEATTDGNGHFVVSNMPAGTFNVQVQAEGYSDNPPANMVVLVGLSDRQRLRHDVALSAVSSISGRIVDDNREPLAGISVEILRQSRDFTGRANWQTVASAVSDEKGAYRFDDLSRGDFYVRASTTFFPGTLDPRAAAAISLRDGDIKTAEFSLAKDRTFAISGTIKNADDSRLQPVKLFILPQDPSIPLDEFFASGVPVNEKFELKGLLPGAYDLLAVSLPSRRTGPGFSSAMRAAKGFVQVRDEDVLELSFSLETGGEVSGRIQFAGENAALPRLRLTLTRRDDFLAGMARAGVLQSTYSFKFSDTVPGVYDVSAVMPEGNAYVADVRAFGRSIIEDGLTVGHDAIDSLEIWIDVDGGTVAGSVTSPKKSPVLVVLAPQSFRRLSYALRAEGLDDPSKQFTFSNVPPGRYSLFAVELTSADELLPVLSPDFLSLYQGKSISIHVEKGATVTPAPLILISR